MNVMHESTKRKMELYLAGAMRLNLLQCEASYVISALKNNWKFHGQAVELHRRNAVNSSM